MFNNIKDNKGFTLIELIMVTIILGILSAVAVPRYLGTVTKAEEAAEDAVIAGIKAGLSNYAMEQMFSGGRKSSYSPILYVADLESPANFKKKLQP